MIKSNSKNCLPSHTPNPGSKQFLMKLLELQMGAFHILYLSYEFAQPHKCMVLGKSAGRMTFKYNGKPACRQGYSALAERNLRAASVRERTCNL
jgi:hypothetical protein